MISTTKLLVFIFPLLLAYHLSNYLAILRNDPYYLTKPFGIDEIATLSVNKSIVITGANSGVGFSSAKLLNDAGTAKVVILACRNIEKCEAAKSDILSRKDKEEDNDDGSDHEGIMAKPALVVMHLDLASIASVRKFADNVQHVLRQYDSNNNGSNNDNRSPPQSEATTSAPKLDILINNAGIMAVPYEIAAETNSEMHMHVNHLAHFALTSFLIKNLEAGRGRIVSVSALFLIRRHASSIGGNTVGVVEGIIKRYLPLLQSLYLYGASKRANLLFTHGLNKRLQFTRNIQAVAAHPGYSRTNLMNKWHYVPVAIRRFVKWNPVGSMSTEEGALCQIRAALDVEHVGAGEYVGPLGWVMGRPVVVGSVLQSSHHLMGGVEEDEVDQLWDFSEKALGLTFR
mmetsp:Transcript_24277/g.28599  ORF Transcript_24277/g.28599 Transcript_24277/m.28599 type:complete len:400 (+) Transcript_24277:160-1359(+)